MEQSVWGLSSQPLRLSDQIWREIPPNKVFTTTSTRFSTKEEIPCQLVEPYSGKNLSFANLACQEINLHPNHLSKLVIFRMNVNNQLVKMKVSLSLLHSTFSYHFKPYSFPNLQFLQLLAVHQLQFRCLKTLNCFITFPWDSSDCLDCHCAVT